MGKISRRVFAEVKELGIRKQLIISRKLLLICINRKNAMADLS